MIFTKSPERFQRGQANTEYIVIVGALVAAMMVDIDIQGTKQTAMEHLTDAIKRSYTGYSYGISVSELPDNDNKEPDNTN